MRLPGGLRSRGELRRDFAFKPVTGEIEVAIAESDARAASVPRRVTAVLAASLDRLAGESPTLDSIRELCVADRQFLIRQLAALLDRDQVWLTATCGQCAAAFDFPVEQSSLELFGVGWSRGWTGSSRRSVGI